MKMAGCPELAVQFRMANAVGSKQACLPRASDATRKWAAA